MINQKELANLMEGIRIVKDIVELHPELDFTLIVKDDEALVVDKGEKKYRCHIVYEDIPSFCVLEKGRYSMLDLGIEKPIIKGE